MRLQKLHDLTLFVLLVLTVPHWSLLVLTGPCWSLINSLYVYGSLLVLLVVRAG